MIQWDKCTDSNCEDLNYTETLNIFEILASSFGKIFVRHNLIWASKISQKSNMPTISRKSVGFTNLLFRLTSGLCQIELKVSFSGQLYTNPTVCQYWRLKIDSRIYLSIFSLFESIKSGLKWVNHINYKSVFKEFLATRYYNDQ